MIILETISLILFWVALINTLNNYRWHIKNNPKRQYTALRTIQDQETRINAISIKNEMEAKSGFSTRYQYWIIIVLLTAYLAIYAWKKMWINSNLINAWFYGFDILVIVLILFENNSQRQVYNLKAQLDSILYN